MGALEKVDYCSLSQGMVWERDMQDGSL